ncbi:MAG: hypothetical protein Q4D62_00290 [Planctomycetia bacterium]|nr:hypothetical protein [Planctomycetia bacterium]
MKIGKIFVVLWLLAGWEASAVDIAWNDVSGEWSSTTSAWQAYDDSTKTWGVWDGIWGNTSNRAFIGNGATVTHNGNLTVSQALFVGYHEDAYNGHSTINPSTGKLVVYGNLDVRFLHVGVHMGNEPTFTETSVQAKSLYKGEITVVGNLTATGEVRVGVDGSAKLTVLKPADNSDVMVNISPTIGTSKDFIVGKQVITSDKSDYFTNAPGDPIQVDFSEAKDVTINVNRFLIGAEVASNLGFDKINAVPAITTGCFRPMTEVKMGINNYITASQLVVSSSYQTVQSSSNLLELGGGENVLKVDNVVIGYWKAESYTTDGEGNRVPGNIVSIRDNGTFELQGNNTSTANLMVGYSTCSTNNVSYGMLDLANASSVKMTLEKFLIGMKLEQPEGTGIEGSNLKRQGGSVGVVKLGNNANVTANVLQMGYKEASNISSDSTKWTRGTLEFGGSSEVTVDSLYTGNSENLNLIGYSTINMNGGSLTVKNGVRFYDNVDFTVDGGTVKIEKGETAQTPAPGHTGGSLGAASQTDTIQMYARMNLTVKNGGTFTVTGNVNRDEHLELGGYYDFKVTDGGTLKFDGNVTLANRLEMVVGGGTGTSTVEVTGSQILQAGDTRITGSSEGGSTINRIEVGTAYLKVQEGGHVIFGDNNVPNSDPVLETRGNALVEITGGTLDVNGTAVMNADLQNYMDIVMADGVSTSTIRWNYNRDGEGKGGWQKLNSSTNTWDNYEGDYPTTESWYGNSDGTNDLVINQGTEEGGEITVKPGASAPEGLTVARKTVFSVSGNGVCNFDAKLTAIKPHATVLSMGRILIYREQRILLLLGNCSNLRKSVEREPIRFH